MASDISQRIVLLIESIDKTKKGINSALSNTQRLKKSMMQGLQVQKEELALAQKGIDVTKSRSAAMKGFGSIMSMNQQTFNDWNQQGAKNATTGGRFAGTIRNLTQGMRGFRMELLGVMFFGMGMQKMFMGLLQPAAQAAGIFDIIAITLQTLFLPVMIELLPHLLALSDWFLGLPEEAQLAIGVFAILGVIIGTLLFFIGMLGLGIGSLIGAFGPILGATGLAEGGFVALHLSLSAIASVILVVAGLAILLMGAWQKNAAGISFALSQLNDAFQRFFVPIQQIVEGVIEFIGAIFAGDAQAAFDALKKIVKNAVAAIIIFFTDLLPNILFVLQQVLWGIGAFSVGIGKTLFDLGLLMLNSLARGIVSAYGVVKEAIRGIPIIGPIIAGGLDIAESIAGFIGKAIGDVGVGAFGAIGDFASFIGGVIPRFANGGIVTKPTLALIGESGPEAITPLGEGVGNTVNNVTFNISASISNDMDIRELASRINDLLVQDYRRLSFR